MAIKSDVRCSYWFCCCSVAQLCPILCDLMDCSTPSSLSFTISQSLLKFMSIESVRLSNHLILCCPLILPSIFPSIRVCLFQWVSSLDQVANTLQLQHQSAQWIFREWSINKYSLGLTGLISLLSKGLSSLLQHHNSKASIFQCSAFFMVQLSHPHMATGKTIALTIHGPLLAKWCLLFNILSRFVTAFLPRSKHLLISWLQSLSAVILGPKKIKSITVFTLTSSICHEVMGLDA